MDSMNTRVIEQGRQSAEFRPAEVQLHTWSFYIAQVLLYNYNAVLKSINSRHVVMHKDRFLYAMLRHAQYIALI